MFLSIVDRDNSDWMINWKRYQESKEWIVFLGIGVGKGIGKIASNLRFQNDSLTRKIRSNLRLLKLENALKFCIYIFFLSDKLSNYIPSLKKYGIINHLYDVTIRRIVYCHLKTPL